MYNDNDPESVELYSCAVTLSDMEVFIFPQLMYSLFLANLMSPEIWQWRLDPWFSKIDKMNPSRRIQRLKQYIMDHFSFNLDLDTWGLTNKQRELKRFSPFIDESILSQSNALFGYEGDKYYFDIDIRKHFGLDKYTSDTIPYWKTETVEAMSSFKYKEGYSCGAGECVSLAALYAASAFAVANIPLDEIYMMATPLHSQNFLDTDSGIVTNNRRIVTKKMWFNGTELSAKARRAIENERITIIAHRTGYIHTVYDTATISKVKYEHFTSKLGSFLKTKINYEILANFLRQSPELQRSFQITHKCCGKPRYIEAEKVYHYEHSSKARVGDTTQNILLHEIEEDEYYTEPLKDRILLSELETFFSENQALNDNTKIVEKLEKFLHQNCLNDNKVIHDLINFCITVPRLPSCGKTFLDTEPIDLCDVHSSQDVIDRLEKLRTTNPVADLAFSAFRDLSRSPVKPFLKAAFERNPVSINGMKDYTIKEIYDKLCSFTNESIYSGTTRFAQPDEVYNFCRGDGLEKAFLFINIIKSRFTDDIVEIKMENDSVISVIFRNDAYSFKTGKKINIDFVNSFIQNQPFLV